jgi:hypothetical protein
VSALRLARLSSDWLLRWRAYWRHFPNRRPFLDEAIKRLSNRPLDKHLIRLLILIAPHGKDRGDFEDLALYLLSQIPKTEREWPYIWCRIMLNEPSAEILSVGLEYLGAFEPGVAAKMGGIEYSEAEIGRWIRVWRRLLQHSGERHRAIAMAREREAPGCLGASRGSNSEQLGRPPRGNTRPTIVASAEVVAVAAVLPMWSMRAALADCRRRYESAQGGDQQFRLTYNAACDCSGEQTRPGTLREQLHSPTE